MSECVFNFKLVKIIKSHNSAATTPATKMSTNWKSFKILDECLPILKKAHFCLNKFYNIFLMKNKLIKASIHCQRLLAKISAISWHDIAYSLLSLSIRIISICIAFAQGGQGKYSSDCHLLLSLAVLP